MIETVVAWGMIIFTVFAVSVGVLLVAGYVVMFVYKKRAHQALLTMKAGFVDDMQGTTDMSRKTLPAWTCALIFALRAHMQEQVKMWLPELIGQLEETIESRPFHVIDTCRELKQFREKIAFDLYMHEQDALACANLCRHATRKSLDATCSIQEQLHRLVTDERFASFSLQEERSHIIMLRNALEANKAVSMSESDECLYRLLVQTRMLTECALEAARITVDKGFIDAAWTSIDIRLEQFDHAFSFVTSWAALMPAASDDWNTEETLEKLKESLADVARLRESARGIGVGGSVSPTVAVFFLRCRLSHSALADAEETIRGLMTSLSDAVIPKNDRQAIVR